MDIGIGNTENGAARGRKARLRTFTGALAVISVFGAFYRPVVVQGRSMAPALNDGQLVWMAKQHYRWHDIRKNDIVIFRHSDDIYIKRVYATEGMVVPILRSYDGAARLVDGTRNRKEIAELLRARPQLGTLEGVRVPPRCVFVLGDNRNVSLDSRDIGPIPVREIVGFVPDPMAGPPRNPSAPAVHAKVARRLP